MGVIHRQFSKLMKHQHQKQYMPPPWDMYVKYVKHDGNMTGLSIVDNVIVSGHSQKPMIMKQMPSYVGDS